MLELLHSIIKHFVFISFFRYFSFLHRISLKICENVNLMYYVALLEENTYVFVLTITLNLILFIIFYNTGGYIKLH